MLIFGSLILKQKKEVVYSYSDSKTGSFLVTLPVNKDYALFVERDGYLPYSVNFTLTVPENSDEPYHRDIPLVALNSIGDEITLENVFFDLDSYNLRPESYIELDKLAQYLTDNPGLKIELQGHTDTQGDDKHNLELSQNRAKAVYDYLISKGIAKERLTYKGFGETQPVITDEEIAKLTTDKEIKAAHQKNRRTVYKIVAI